MVRSPEERLAFMDRVEQMQLKTEHRPGSRAEVSIELGDRAFQNMRRLYVVRAPTTTS